MSVTAVSWIESTGVPLVLIPETKTSLWRGIDGPDYEEACAITDYIGLLRRPWPNGMTTKIRYPERPKGGQFGAAFQQDFIYDRFGNVTRHTLPACVTNGDGFKPCADGDDRIAPSHTVNSTYNQGIPRSVTSSLGPSATHSYHFNFQPSSTNYGNGVIGTFDEGPSHLARPRRIRYSTAAGTLWDSGLYTYDGAGNIAGIGDDVFIYDRASRLRSGTVNTAGPNRRESLTYDAADNVTRFARDGGTPVAHNVDATSNRLLGRRGDHSIVWDDAGSVTHIGEHADSRPVFIMTNGPFRRQTSFEITADHPSTPSKRWTHAFGPGDIRLMVEDRDGKRRWTFRDPSDRIAREFLESNGRWNHERDFIHGPTSLMATRRHNGLVRYFHPDHLSTPRLLTAADGQVFSRKNYYPFGAEIEDPAEILLDDFESGDTRFWLESKDEPRVAYTGHERDAHGLTDYMLARTYLYPFYRFGSVDPARDGWNLYSYVRNNPLKYLDPDGLDVSIIFDFSAVDLPKRQQSAIMQNVRSAFTSAGVENVRVFRRRTGLRSFFSDGTPNVDGKHHKFRLKLEASLDASGREVLGSTSIIMNDRSQVSTAFTPESEPAATNQLSNTAAHEAAHQTDLYLFDGMGGPSGERGSIMEQGVSAQTLGEALRHFSEDDAVYLRERLNDGTAGGR